MGINYINQTDCTEFSGNMAVWCHNFPVVLLFCYKKGGCWSVLEKITVLSPTETAVGRWGAGTLFPQTCQHLGTSAGLTNIPLRAAKTLLICCASHQLFIHGEAQKKWLLWKAVWPLGRLMRSPRKAKKRRWGSETKTRWGTPFPADLNRTTPWLDRPVSKQNTLVSWAQRYPTQIPHQGERPSLS